VNSKKVIIIGAGPSGMTAAYQLSRLGYKPTLIEASDSVGGMAKTIELWGQRVDLGPHRFFSSDKVVNDLFKEVLQDNFTMVNRLTRIYYRNRFFYYPLKIGNVLKTLPVSDIVSILLSYMWIRISPPKNISTFEDWVVNKFGRKLFNIFFKNYSEKLWGISCKRIDASWAAQRIKKLSLVEAVKSAIFGDKQHKHKTLVDQFAYPKGGTGTLYTTMATYVQDNGGEILYNTKVRKVINSAYDITGVQLEDGRIMDADVVISTMPLTLMLNSLQGVPQDVKDSASKLFFRNTTLVYLQVDAKNLFPDNWLYIHSPEVLHGRITNFHNWCPSLLNGHDETIICLEYWSFDNDKIWNESSENLIELAKSEIKKIKLLPAGSNILNGYVHKIPRCYPVYEIGYAEHLDKVVEHLKHYNNLIPIGRYGSFKYNNQDHSILMGILAAKQIHTGRDQQLWDINADSEYQEDAIIDDSNLPGSFHTVNKELK